MAVPIRMLHIFPSFAIGGQQRRLAILAGELGDEFAHCVRALDGDMSALALFQRPDAIDAAALPLQKSSSLNFGNLKTLQREFEAAKPDILCTYNWGALEAAFANGKAKIPHIHFEDGFGADENPSKQKWRRILARRMALRNSTVIAASLTLENLAIEKWKLKPERVHFIPNGIEVDKFAAPDRSATDKVVIGTVGALRREKNYGRLLNMARDITAAEVHLVGAGPEDASLKRIAADMRARFLGETSAPESVYPDFDIFALSSDTEQMPISLMEAMAAGLPVVSTDVGDIKSMVSAENHPFITPLDDDAGYRAALETLVGNRSLRAQIGQANAEKARAAFSAEAMVKRHRKLYLAAVG